MERRYFEKNIIKMDQENYTPTQRKIFQLNFNFNFIYKLGRTMDGFNNNQKINPQMKRRYFEKNIIKMDQGSKQDFLDPRGGGTESWIWTDESGGDDL